MQIKYYVIKHLILLKKCNGYQRGLALMVYKFFDKKTFDKKPVEQ